MSFTVLRALAALSESEAQAGRLVQHMSQEVTVSSSLLQVSGYQHIAFLVSKHEPDSNTHTQIKVFLCATKKKLKHLFKSTLMIASSFPSIAKP